MGSYCTITSHTKEIKLVRYLPNIILWWTISTSKISFCQVQTKQVFFSGPLEPNWKTLLHCSYRLIKSVFLNYSIENHKRFPKHTEPHWIKVKTKILDIFLSDKLPLCLCYFSKLVISFTLTHQSFYLSKEQNKKHLIFFESWLHCKSKESVSESSYWIPGQHSVWFCLKESWNLFTSLTPQTRSTHLKFNSALLRSMDSPTRISHKLCTWSYY